MPGLQEAKLLLAIHCPGQSKGNIPYISPVADTQKVAILGTVYYITLQGGNVMHQSFESPSPPSRACPGESGDNHLIFISLCFPGRWDEFSLSLLCFGG